MQFFLGDDMLNEELLKVKEIREEARINYAEHQEHLYNECDIACSLSAKNQALSLLKVKAYICACNLDMPNVEMVYNIARERAIISNDYTIHDFVIGSCHDLGDIVTAFKWVLQANQGKDDALRLSIVASLNNFKYHPSLQLVYTDLLNMLIEEYLPQEEGTQLFTVRDAIVVLLSRLLRFPELIQYIEKENDPSALYCRLWLEHKWECANTEVENIEDIDNNAIVYWRKLAEICMENQSAIHGIGRLYYPMRWYLTHTGEDERIFFEKVLMLLLYSNHHITRIKEMMNIPLELFDPEDHITIYMSPKKFKRVFTPREGTSQVYWSLTCADHMNDDFEGKVLFDYLKECGVSLFDERVLPFGLIDKNERASVFLGSVSRTINDEYMYELYASGQGERGFCVDIDVSSFDSIIEDSLVNDEYEWICPLYNMQYANKIDDIVMPNVRMELKRLGKNLSLISLSAQQYKKEHEESEISYSKMIYRMLEEIAYLFKRKEGFDNKVKRNWEQEQEMRMMKCVRGESSNKVISEERGKQYLNYFTQKRIIVRNIYGGSSEEKLRAAKKIIYELQQDLYY